MDREPAVAGRFYGADPGPLARQVDGFLASTAPPLPALGVVAPHAGYVYSGAIAGAAFARVEVPGRVLVLGPNHTGLGAPAALWPEGAWRTPLGAVALDAELTEALLASPEGVARPERSRREAAKSKDERPITLDARAHLLEHSLEVQLPFLQRARPGVRIAALCLGHLPFPACERVARAVAAATREAGALLVASSDMSHYVDAGTARRLDGLALERLVALDPQGLYEVVHREGITMCGIVPATVMLLAALARGATSAELVRYGSSGEVTGDDSSVVGYAGVVVR